MELGQWFNHVEIHNKLCSLDKIRDQTSSDPGYTYCGIIDNCLCNIKVFLSGEKFIQLSIVPPFG